MRDAEVLIRDEPTAALDARSEYEVFQRFRDLSVGKTAILISHRFSTVRMADRILVLRMGRLWRLAHTKSLLHQAGATPNCLNCRRPVIDNGTTRPCDSAGPFHCLAQAQHETLSKPVETSLFVGRGADAQTPAVDVRRGIANNMALGGVSLRML